MNDVVAELVDVERTFEGEVPVRAIKPCSLAIHSGDYVAITGPSGSGKSTLLNLIGLLDTPTSGRYLIDGINVADLPDESLAAVRGQLVGFVFQAHHLLPDRSATENVMLSSLYRGISRSKRFADAAEALERVQLGHRLSAKPSTLSGGESQRVAIARAIVNRPRLLLCDEPTGNLDSASTTEVLDLLDRLNKEGVTIAVITHDAAVAQRSRRELTINDGVVSEPGK